MRKLPMIVAAAFLAIQLQRVADFIDKGLNGGPVLGWFFAIGLAVGVFASSYWTRQSITRKDETEDPRDKQSRSAAWLSLGIFVLLDGTFNLAETLRALLDKSLLVFAVIYGVAPTVIAVVLGRLQGRIDRLPVPPRKSRWGGVLNAVAARLERAVAVEPAEIPAEAPVVAAEPVAPAGIPVEIPVPAKVYKCDVPLCGWSTDTCAPEVRNDPVKAQHAYAGHKRSHSQKSIKVQPAQQESIKQDAAH